MERASDYLLRVHRKVSKVRISFISVVDRPYLSGQSYKYNSLDTYIGRTLIGERIFLVLTIFYHLSIELSKDSFSSQYYTLQLHPLSYRLLFKFRFSEFNIRWTYCVWNLVTQHRSRSAILRRNSFTRERVIEQRTIQTGHYPRRYRGVGSLVDKKPRQKNLWKIFRLSVT